MNVIETDGLSKRYLLGDDISGYGTLRETLTQAFRRGTPRGGRRELWALRDVSLEVAAGERVGIVGRNGAGKSTLFKILARITPPTEGVARTRGRVGALLEVGTAFHPELTGRENIEINGALLGMTRADIRRRFDEIVAFSGVESFLDTPVKRYSSGMYLRLAFSVAAHFEPDIAVVDEVLATGDAEFQERCMAKMAELGEEGRTVVIVSHDLPAIGRLCGRVIWMDAGRVVADGPPQETLERYIRAAVGAGTRRTLEREDADVQLTEVSLEDERGSSIETLMRGEPFAVRAGVDVRAPMPGLDLAFWVTARDGTRVVDERLLDHRRDRPLAATGRHGVALRLPGILTAGDYTVGAWLGTDDRDFINRELLEVRVVPRPEDPAEFTQRRRSVAPAASWSVDGAARSDR